MTTVLVRCESLLIGSICLGSHGFAHPVKVDVRLVSFPCPAFEMTWPQNYDPLHNVALSTATVVHSVALAALVGILVSLQAYVFQFTEIVVK